MNVNVRRAAHCFSRAVQGFYHVCLQVGRELRRHKSTSTQTAVSAVGSLCVSRYSSVSHSLILETGEHTNSLHSISKICASCCCASCTVSARHVRLLQDSVVHSQGMSVLRWTCHHLPPMLTSLSTDWSAFRVMWRRIAVSASGPNTSSRADLVQSGTQPDVLLCSSSTRALLCEPESLSCSRACRSTPEHTTIAG